MPAVHSRACSPEGHSLFLGQLLPDNGPDHHFSSMVILDTTQVSRLCLDDGRRKMVGRWDVKLAAM
jgi:hypothetical protein